MRVMTHKSREFQRVTSQMHVVSVHIACAARIFRTHMALGALGATTRVSPGAGAKRGIH